MGLKSIKRQLLTPLLQHRWGLSIETVTTFYFAHFVLSRLRLFPLDFFSPYLRLRLSGLENVDDER